MKVGMIGLGLMGQGIAGRILNAGHDLVVYNRTPGKAAQLVKAGARVASSIAAACEAREIVITMLADDQALTQIASREGGLVRSMARGTVHVAMGTHGVQTLTALGAEHAAAGQEFVAAPVLGRPHVAAAGELVIIAGGTPATVEHCRPLFEVIGRRTVDAGTRPEAAAAMKLANNFMIGCAIEAMGEAFALVQRFGATPAAMYDMVTEGLFAAPIYKFYGRIIVDNAYDEPGFTALLGLKDANLMLAAAEVARVPLPSANVFRDRLLGAIAHGDENRDWAVMALEQERASGLR